MQLEPKQCHVCGFTCTWRDYRYFDFREVLQLYRVGYIDICGDCGDQANRFINYYGRKRPEDVAALKRFLVSGVLPMRDYSALMNAGYYA